MGADKVKRNLYAMRGLKISSPAIWFDKKTYTDCDYIGEYLAGRLPSVCSAEAKAKSWTPKNWRWSRSGNSCGTEVGNSGHGLILIRNIEARHMISDKCFFSGRSCAELQWESSTAMSELFSLQRTINNPKHVYFKVIFRPTLLCVFVCLCF